MPIPIHRFIIHLTLFLTLALISLNSHSKGLSRISSDNRLALIIGNADYPIARLRNTLNDADDMAQVLSDLGFEVILKPNANQKTMIKAIKEFGKRLRRGGIGVFYYSGHGMQLKEQNFLIPIDVEFKSVNVQQVLQQMQSAKTRINIVILDACRDNPFARQFKSLTRGLARIKNSPSGTLIAYATAPGDVAADGKGRNGTFTKHLLALLRTKPNLSITDLFSQVTGKVMVETSGKQVPWQSVSLPERFCFSGCDELSPKPNLKKTYFQDSLKNGKLAPAMVWIPAGSFKMGDNYGDVDEKPVHWVNINRFAIGQNEITFADYQQFASATGRTMPDDEQWGQGEHPVIHVSWFDAMAYTKWLSKQTGENYRLATEAEWEYASRAGTETAYWWGNTASHNYANYGANRCCRGLATGKDKWEYTAPVGSFAANPFELHDTVGNVSEWTCSEYQQQYNGKEQLCLNPSQANDESLIVIRGGSWGSFPKRIRSAERDARSAVYHGLINGFRVVRE